jgi:hypothetical protein
LQLESHDFSKYDNMGASCRDSEMEDSEHGESDSGSSSHKRSRVEGVDEMSVPITSLALSYPSALLEPPRRVKVEAKGSSPTSKWFAKPSISQPDAKHHLNDQDSCTSTTTSTTAESSYSAMVSRDWGATTSAGIMGNQVAENSLSSSTANQDIHFQCGNPGALNVTDPCATSSLTHALNRFNIDSDCDASVTSGSIIGGSSIMNEDEDNNMMDEDDSSVHSHSSYVSAGSTHHVSSRGRGRKAGKKGRILDRASAHERILQIRNEQSQKTRASLVQLQRTSSQDAVETRSRSSSTSSQNSIPLLHVQYGRNDQDVTLRQSAHAYGDLSRTPTASNCSEKSHGLQAPTFLFYPGSNFSLPAGVHVSPNRSVDASFRNNISFPESLPGRPLQFHPQLALTTPPASSMLVQKDATPDDVKSNHTSSSASQVGSSLLHSHHRQSSLDDVLDVVEALSKLSGRGKGMIPRFR